MNTNSHSLNNEHSDYSLASPSIIILLPTSDYLVVNSPVPNAYTPIYEKNQKRSQVYAEVGER